MLSPALKLTFKPCGCLYVNNISAKVNPAERMASCSHSSLAISLSGDKLAVQLLPTMHVKGSHSSCCRPVQRDSFKTEFIALVLCYTLVCEMNATSVLSLKWWRHVYEMMMSHNTMLLCSETGHRGWRCWTHRRGVRMAKWQGGRWACCKWILVRIVQKTLYEWQVPIFKHSAFLAGLSVEVLSYWKSNWRMKW